MKNILRLFMVLFVSGSAFSQEKKVVNVEEFEKGIQAGNAIILDVRRADEFSEGHIENAVNINWQNSDEFKNKAAQLDKSKTVYVYCLAGIRSEKASDWLLKNGFINVIGLEGGIEAWKKAGKPVKNELQN